MAPFIAGQSWDYACAMAAVVGLSFLFGSCVAHKLHNWLTSKVFRADTKNYKKMLFWALSLMAIILFAISGDLHYSKSGTQTTRAAFQQPEVLFGGDMKKILASVVLFCIFMLIYSVGVRHSVSVLEDRFICQRTSGTGTVIYKAINTTTNWLAVPLLIHLFLLNWRHIGLGWILVLLAMACLLAVTYVVAVLPDDGMSADVTTAEVDDADGNNNAGANPQTATDDEIEIVAV